jgi:hypothetical protein
MTARQGAVSADSESFVGLSRDAPRGLLALAALDLAALVGPVEEVLQLIAIFPAQFEELSRGQVSGFGAKVGLEAPAEIGAVPGIEAIALGRQPVVAEKLPHSFGVWRHYGMEWSDPASMEMKQPKLFRQASHLLEGDA